MHTHTHTAQHTTNPLPTKKWDPVNVLNHAIEMEDKKIHPELLKLTLEIIKTRQKMEENQEQETEEKINSSIVEPVEIVEKDSSIVEKKPSFMEHVETM